MLNRAIDATTGTRFPTVLFRVLEGAIVPDPEVTQLAVDGQLLGRAMNLVVREVLGPDTHIFAMGTTLTAPGHPDDRTFEQAAGVGVGPELGTFEDQAVWQVMGEVPVEQTSTSEVTVTQSNTISINLRRR